MSAPLTMDSTIMGSIGNGVLNDSPHGASALGMGGLSTKPGEASSSSAIFLQAEPRLIVRRREANDARERVGVAVLSEAVEASALLISALPSVLMKGISWSVPEALSMSRSP